MLYPSDPSCSSSKFFELKDDANNSNQLNLKEVHPFVSFGETNTPDFCLRDYVFASRSKNNVASWPFPHRLLKLFIKHGIRDTLPPFESANSVRELFCVKVNSNLIDEDYEVGSTLTNQPDIERLSTKLGGEPAAKKCYASRAEEIASTSTASDIMASKICPVCKTFSSTSNTTLNAHMDRCLSMASDATENFDRISKIVVKPMKKRMMEDIYVDALRCTLEDLDRRNGTSWATDLSLVIAPIEANCDAKKVNFSHGDGRDERSEGAVYVDSNGVKVRILSKFDDSPQVVSKKVVRLNLVGDGKTSLISKKKHFVGEKCGKRVKLKMENKKLSSLKLLRNQSELEDSHNEESNQEEGSADKSSSQQEQANMSCGTSTLQKWHCSKRSYLPKKICNTNFVKNTENPIEFMTQIRNSASNTSKIVDFSANSTPLQNMSNEVQISQKDLNFKGTSTNVLRLKLSKASGALIPSKSCRNGDSLIGRKQKPLDFLERDNRLTENCHTSLKMKKISTLSKSNLSTKMFDKHKRKREITSVLDEEYQSLNSTKTKNCASQTENMDFINFARASSEKIDGSCVNGLILDSEDKTSQIMPMKEFGISMKRDETTSDKLGATSTESSDCLTSHGDLGPDTPGENCCSIASTQLVLNQESNLVINREPSGSPISSSSFSTSVGEPVSKLSASQEQFENPLIRPCLSSSFLKTTSLESPTESIMTRCCSVVSNPPSQSSSNSILRLMGKNLMVTHNEESSDIVKVDFPAKDHYISPSSYVGAPHYESFNFMHACNNNVHPSNLNLKEADFVSCSSNEDMMMRATLLPVQVSHTMFQGPQNSYFSQQNRIFLREIGSSSSYLINEGSSLDVQATLFPRPIVFRPTSDTHLNPSLYYPQSLR